MLTLMTFAGSFDQPSHSPFCVKAMCLLQMSGQVWTPEYLANPTSMPLGRLPVLKVQDRLIPDSSAIAQFLEQQGADFNQGLTGAEKAQSHPLIRMVEDSLHMGLIHDRWLRDDTFPIVRKAFFDAMPFPLRQILPPILRRKIRAKLMSHGIAQFSEAERVARLEQDVGALEVQLYGKQFLFGDAPSLADASAVPMLEMIRTLPVETGLRSLVRKSPVICDYTARAREVMYPKVF